MAQTKKSFSTLNNFNWDKQTGCIDPIPNYTPCTQPIHTLAKWLPNVGTFNPVLFEINFITTPHLQAVSMMSHMQLQKWLVRPSGTYQADHMYLVQYPSWKLCSKDVRGGTMTGNLGSLDWKSWLPLTLSQGSDTQ